MVTQIGGQLTYACMPHVICRGVRGMLRPAAAAQHLTIALHDRCKHCSSRGMGAEWNALLA